MFRRRRHKLPKFPPNAAGLFRSLSEALPATEISELSIALNRYLEELEGDLDTEDNLNFALATELIACCRKLLDIYAQVSDKQRAMIVGAIRYLVSDDDGVNDAALMCGFDDDAQVVNHVLEEVGLLEHCIDYRRV